mgnify:CR=1 FL=1
MQAVEHARARIERHSEQAVGDASVVDNYGAALLDAAFVEAERRGAYAAALEKQSENADEHQRLLDHLGHEVAEEHTQLSDVEDVLAEHLLLGLLREEKCFAAEILHERGLRLSAIREELARTSQDIASERALVVHRRSCSRRDRRGRSLPCQSRW